MQVIKIVMWTKSQAFHLCVLAGPGTPTSRQWLNKCSGIGQDCEPCTAHSFTLGRHFAKTCHAYQVIAYPIQALHQAYNEHCTSEAVLDSKNTMDASVADTVIKVESKGAKQYKTLVAERLEQRTKTITVTLPMNKMSLFRHPPVKTQSK